MNRILLVGSTVEEKQQLLLRGYQSELFLSGEWVGVNSFAPNSTPKDLAAFFTLEHVQVRGYGPEVSEAAMTYYNWAKRLGHSCVPTVAELVELTSTQPCSLRDMHALMVTRALKNTTQHQQELFHGLNSWEESIQPGGWQDDSIQPGRRPEAEDAMTVLHRTGSGRLRLSITEFDYRAAVQDDTTYRLGLTVWKGGDRNVTNAPPTRILAMTRSNSPRAFTKEWEISYHSPLGLWSPHRFQELVKLLAEDAKPLPGLLQSYLNKTTLSESSPE